MKMGAEPKKLKVLGGLLALAAIVYYFNSSDSPAPAPPVVVRTAAPASAPAASSTPAPFAERRRSNRALVKEFKLTQGSRDPKDRPPPETIDPTIRWDLLAKVQNLEPGPPGRNVFQFGEAPAPVTLPKNIEKIKTGPVAIAPPQPPPVQGPPPPPMAPPMTFKYYGYKISKSDGHKAAFLLDGEDILIAGENDTVKKKYRVVRISVSSITIEDTEFKSTQTLPLQENLAG